MTAVFKNRVQGCSTPLMLMVFLHAYQILKCFSGCVIYQCYRAIQLTYFLIDPCPNIHPKTICNKRSLESHFCCECTIIADMVLIVYWSLVQACSIIIIILFIQVRSITRGCGKSTKTCKMDQKWFGGQLR